MIKHIIRKKNIPYFILLAFLFGCDYSPTDTNFKTVTPPQNNVEITVLDTNAINQLRGRVTFGVQTELNGHSVKFVTGFLDDKEVSLYMSDPSHVVFNTEYYSDGEYTFTLILVASSNTGSLADRLGVEAIYSAKQYQVTIFNAPISTPSIKDFSIENGSLKINWEKYDQLCFKQYVLKKNGSVIATIDDINQTSYYDTTYFAGYASYVVTTKVMNFEITSGSYAYQGVTPTFVSASSLPGEKVLLTWNKYPFTTQFGKYGISGLETYAEITTINDTTLIDENPPLGSGGRYFLSVYSKTGEDSAQAVGINGQPIGTPFYSGESHVLKYIPEKNLFINISYSRVTYNHTISYHDGSTLGLLKSRVLDNDFNDFGLGISDNGDYIYYSNDRKVYKINSTSLLKEDEVDLIDLMPPGNYRSISPIHTVKINNNNQLAAVIVDFYRKMMLSFFDMNSKQWIATYKFDYGSDTEDLYISDDQEHIILLRHVYRYDGNNLTEIGLIPSYYPAFSKDYSSIIVSFYDKIQVLRSTDLQLLVEIPGNFYYSYPSVDTKTGLFGVNGKIFDPFSGQERGSIRVRGLNHYYLNGFYFADGYYKYVELH